jgi:hypothetical protein
MDCNTHGRPAMRSPGRPPIHRDAERAFWVKIAEGLTSEDAAIVCGVSGPVGSRWFAGTWRYAIYTAHCLVGERSIVHRVGGDCFAEGPERECSRDRAQAWRSPSTISRELRRNAATRTAQLEYRASIAQGKAELMSRRPKTAILVASEPLRN